MANFRWFLVLVLIQSMLIGQTCGLGWAAPPVPRPVKEKQANANLEAYAPLPNLFQAENELSAVASIPSERYPSEFINPLTGRLQITVTDLEVPAGPMSLKVKRSLSGSLDRRGLLGSRWRLNWDKRLFRQGKVVLLEGAESILLFRPQEDGSYRALTGESLELQASHGVVTRGDGVREFFDGAGKLLGRNEKNGNRTLLRYDAEGRLTRVEGPFGAALTFRRNAQGQLTRISGSNGTHVLYALGDFQPNAQDKHLWSTMKYEPQGALASITHPRTGETRFNYDSQGRVARRTWSDDASESFLYDDEQRVCRHTSPTGEVTVTQWTSDRLWFGITNPAGQTNMIQLDPAGRLVGASGPNESGVKIKYDRLGRIEGLHRSTTGFTRFVYAGNNAEPSLGVGPTGSEIAFHRDSEGNLTSVGPRGDAKSLQVGYAQGGLVETIANQEGTQFRAKYNHRGLIESTSDAAGNITKFEYDAQGKQIAVIDPQGHVTRRSFDSQGRLVSVVDPEGGTTKYLYNRRGLVGRRIDPLGGNTDYQYNSRGRLSTVKDAAGRTTQYAHDAAGRVLSVEEPGGATHRYKYGKSGRLEGHRNPLGGAHYAVYDPSGKMRGYQSATGSSLQYDFDKFGKITNVKGNWGAAKYLHDPLGRLVRTIDHLGRVTRYEYDKKNNLVMIIPPVGGIISRSYDNLGRVIEAKRGGKMVVRYGYNRLGQKNRRLTPAGVRLPINTTPLAVSAAGKTISGVAQRSNMTEMVVRSKLPTCEARPPNIATMPRGIFSKSPILSAKRGLVK